MICNSDKKGLAGIYKWRIRYNGIRHFMEQLEFRENKKDLIFEREYNLSKEPIRTDLLIIKKATETKIRNEIGDIFRTYNVIEEKASATVTVPVYNSSVFLG